MTLPGERWLTFYNVAADTPNVRCWRAVIGEKSRWFYGEHVGLIIWPLDELSFHIRYGGGSDLMKGPAGPNTITPDMQKGYLFGIHMSLIDAYGPGGWHLEF